MSASIITSVLTGGSNSHQTVSEEVNNIATDFVTQGIVGSVTRGVGSTAGTGGFAVTQDASPDMGVTVLAGRAYVACTPSGQDAQVLNARMSSNYASYTINSNSTGSTVYDWIYLKADATNANTPSTAGDNVITLYTSRSTSNSSDNGSPPTYGYLLAVVTVANGAISITNSNIADKRTQCTLATGSSASTTGWTSTNATLTYNANNGNKEFVLDSDTDLTGTISPGMKLQVTRSVTPPTQCMSFTAASSQYATKASPAGITFTSAFTCEAWVYLNSYTGTTQTIIQRRDTTNGAVAGWYFDITSSGQLELGYVGSSQFTVNNTYQSLPLKRWVHVAATATTASKSVALFINGTSVAVQNTAANATTVTQPTGDLVVGAQKTNVISNYFDGYISEARVWSVAQSQANIQANMAINLTGSESNLVALFQGNGAFTDATSNANNLTAQNGASDTQASNPYNATEYAVVTKVSSTQLTVFTGTQGTIPNQTLTSPQYSVSREPYGFPCGDTDWLIELIILAQTSTSGTTAATTYNPGGLNIRLPIGKWKLSYDFQIGVTTSSAAIDVYASLSTSSTLVDLGSRLNSRFTLNAVTSTTANLFMLHKEASVTVTTDTPYYALVRSTYNFSALSFRGDTTAGTTGGEISVITAECAYV